MSAPTETGSPSLQLQRMLGRPFGIGENGRPIDHGTGKLIIGAIEWMEACVERDARAAVPRDTTEEERAAIAKAARDNAVELLVEMLNAAIDDRRFHVSRAYLLNESHRYSYEFRLFVSEYCRVISGDPEFFRHAGERSIPETLALLGKPLGLQRTYAVLPRFTAKLVKTDLRVVSTAPGSAVIEWRGRDQVSQVPEPHRDAYVRYACATYQGAYSAIPRALFGLPLASVHEVRCQADGSECCEWRFGWDDAQAARPHTALAAGAAVSGILAAVAFAASPAVRLLSLAGAALPLLAAWQRNRVRKIETERSRLQRDLLEERDLAEAEYDRSDRANSELQVANVELAGRVSELTALHETATALSATLDLDEVLDRALHAVASNLGYDRAIVMLADAEQGVISGGRAAGGGPGMEERIASLSLPFSLVTSPLVQAYEARKPLVFTGMDRDPVTENREFALALGVTSFMAVPLLTNGKSLGVLAVDNGVTRRVLDVAGGPLLMTLGSQVATAIEKARLHAQVEAQNRILQERGRKLEAEVRTLRIEIDEARRAKQVAEIVDTDYFRALRTQARELRKIVGDAGPSN